MKNRPYPVADKRDGGERRSVDAGQERQGEKSRMRRAAIERRWPFYLTATRPCPYVEGRLERKIVTKLADPDARECYDTLSRGGFRRSQDFAYRPSCPACRACVPVRVAASEFAPDRSMRRILKVNRGLTMAEPATRATPEQYRLFRRYLLTRHADGEMSNMAFADYREMVETSPIDTRIAEYHEADGRLVAACLLDALDDGFSAVYSFFEPEFERRSLGTFIILDLIERCRALGLPYLYLGYWITGNRKMAYKTRFRPLEALSPKGWTRMGG
jgi:arginine-tRNA-protein transferase